MLRAIIFICNTACSRLVVPGEYLMPQTCYMQAQAYVAETVLVQDGDRVTIQCERKR